MTKLTFIISTFFFLSLQAQAKAPAIENQTISEITKALKSITTFTTSKAGQASDCQCDPGERKSYGELIAEKIKNRLSYRGGVGLSATIDAHAGPVGQNYSIDVLQFGSPLDSIVNSKKVKYAAYCSGGVAAATDVAASAGLSGVKTFGNCDTPESYSGGSIMLSVQGNAAIGSVAGTLNLGFDMKEFGNSIEKDFPTKSKRDEMRNEIKQLLELAKKNPGNKDLLYVKLLGGIFYPSQVPMITKEELNYLIEIGKNKNKRFVPELYQNYKNFLAKQPKNSYAKASRIADIFASSFDECHAISAGLSVGPSAGMPVNVSIGYNDYVLISSVDLNLKKLAPALATLVATDTAEMWDSFLTSCKLRKKKQSDNVQAIASSKNQFKDIIDAQFNPEVLKHACEKSLIDANKQSFKVIKILAE